MKRRVLSVLLSLCLVLSLLPTAAFAQGESYVALGDSITTGYGLTDAENDGFAALVAQEQGYVLDNLAKVGATSDKLLNQLSEDETSTAVENADLITITIGGNDLMGALYQYLADEYNKVNDPDISAGDVQDALAGKDGTSDLQTKLMTVATTVIGDFADSDAATAALQNFGSNLDQIIAAIKSANQDVTIIVANQYNPYSYAAEEATDFIASYLAKTVANAFEAGVQRLNSEVFDAGEQAELYVIADVYGTFSAASDNPCNAYFTSATDMNLDFHPNAYGHELIAEVINSLLAEIGGSGGEEQPEPQVEQLWVNGKNILEATDYTVQCDSGTAVYDPEDNTLTLDNATITNAYTYDEDSYNSPLTSGIYVDGDLTVVLEGENKINNAEMQDGIYSTGSITIQGNSDSKLTAQVDGTGVYSKKGITIDEVEVNVAAAYGLYADKVTIENSNVFVDDADYAIRAVDAITIIDSIVDVTTDLTANGIAIYSNGSLTIKGASSNVDIHGDFFAVQADVVTISGGTVTIESTNFGVWAETSFVITGSPTVQVSGEAGAFPWYSGPVIVDGVEYTSDGDTLCIQNGSVVSGLRIPGEGVMVGGQKLDNTTPEIACGGGKAVYDADTNTLTLTDATITTGYPIIPYTYGIFTDNDEGLTVILEGENTICGVDTGIRAEGSSVTVKGNGSLTINSTYMGIDSMKVDITQNSIIHITVAFDGNPIDYGSGISSGNDGITIDGATVTIDTSYSEGACHGFASNGDITISDSVVNTNGTNGIHTEKNVIISGNSTIQATGTGDNYAILVGSGQIKKDGQVYICTGNTVSIEDGEIISGLSPYVPEEPEPEPERPSDDDDHHDTGSTTESERNPDGSLTTTVTKPDGTTVETTRNPDGSKEVVETKKDGTVITTTTDKSGNETKTTENPDGTSVVSVTRTDGSTSATTVDEDGLSVTVAALSESAVTQGQTGTVSLPMPSVTAASDLDSAPAVTLDLPADTAVKVEIPVENVAAGTVAVLVKADGTSEIVRTSVATADGVVLTLSGGETVKLVDNSKTFADVADTFWGAGAVAFVSSRELFNGTSATDFSPNAPMDRAMIVTVLARLDGADTTTGDTWYEAGAQWAVASGISDGSGLSQSLTREQLATMLYRYAQLKGCDVSAGGNILAYPDGGSVSGYALEAMQWACGAGIIGGKDGLLDPAGNATRAEVATMLMRFVALL